MNIMNPTIKYTSMHIRFIYNAVIRKPLFSYLQTEIDGYEQYKTIITSLLMALKPMITHMMKKIKANT